LYADSIAAGLSWVADLMLAVAVLYVTVQALRGVHKEAQAERLPRGDEKTAKINDAKTFYALASLTKVWVLLFIFGGTVIKLGLSLYQGPWPS